MSDDAPHDPGRPGPSGPAWLEALVRQLPTAAVVAEAPSRSLILMNDEARALLRHPDDAPPAREYAGFRPSDGRAYRSHEWPLARAIETGEVVREEEIEVVRGDGTRARLLVSASPVRDAAGRTVAGVATFQDVTERRRAEAGQRLLAEAGSLLTRSLDYRATLGAAARLLVPGLGDWCAIDLVADDGRLERVEVVHADPAKVALARELQERYPAGEGSAVPLVIRSGEPILVPSVDEDLLRSSARDEEHLRILEGLAIRSLLVAPLVGRSGTLGALTLVSAESGRRYEQADVEMVRMLAGRAALAIENARLFEAERHQRELAERSGERARRLQAVGAALSSILEPEAAAQVVVEEAVDVLGASGGVVALRTATGDELEIVAAAGFQASTIEAVRRFPLSADLPLAEAARTGAAVELGTREERRTRFPLLDDQDAGGTNEAWLALPLRVEERVIGALGLGFRRAEDFEPEERVFLATLAEQCAQALERARLYDAERRARAEAEEANRTKAEFLARMSHELRTPLNAIAGYADLMELGIHGDISDAQRTAIQRIKVSQRHLVALITDILDFAKQESGRLEIEIEDLPVDATLAGLGPLVEPLVRARRVQYGYRPGDPDVRCRADSERLLQVLLNLVGNAVKFTAAGGSVELEWSAHPERVEIRVRDTGRGIPADKLEAVFEPFFQVEPVHTREGGGTGLGLSISRELTRAMGGDLSVESAPGVGSTFTLTLLRA